MKSGGRPIRASTFFWLEWRIWLSLLAFALRPSVSRKIGQEIRTPAPPAAPRINGPSIYGAHPGHPFLYRIPATGARPIKFSAKSLPKGLALDSATGIISGSVKNPESTPSFAQPATAMARPSAPLRS